MSTGKIFRNEALRAKALLRLRRGGRVVEGTGLENRRL